MRKKNQAISTYSWNLDYMLKYKENSNIVNPFPIRGIDADNVKSHHPLDKPISLIWLNWIYRLYLFYKLEKSIWHFEVYSTRDVWSFGSQSETLGVQSFLSFDSMYVWSFIGKMFSSTLLWCCLLRILKCDHSLERCLAVLYCGAVC